MPEITALAEMTITEVLTAWPDTAAVFQRHGMACVGCAVAPYYSVVDAANIYGVEPQQFVAELEEAARNGPSDGQVAGGGPT